MVGGLDDYISDQQYNGIPQIITMNSPYQQNWPYLESSNYQDWNNILQSFPHLKNINPSEPPSSPNAIGIVIRSANDDNVHKVPLLLYRL